MFTLEQYFKLSRFLLKTFQNTLYGFPADHFYAKFESSLGFRII